MTRSNTCLYLLKTGSGTIEPANYDWQGCHILPRLELPEPGKLSAARQAEIAEGAYQALKAAMATPARDVATMAKQHRNGLTVEAIYQRDMALRPDTIPSNTDAIKVDHWEPEKVVSIPLPTRPGKKPEFIRVTIPARPVGTIIGTCDTSAWQAGNHQRIPVHVPQPLPPFKTPQRTMTATETEVAAWLAQPNRQVTRQRRSNRLTSLMARFWDKPDNDRGIDPRNAAIRGGMVAVGAA